MFCRECKIVFFFSLFFGTCFRCEDFQRVMIQYTVGYKDQKTTHETGNMVVVPENSSSISISYCELKKLSKSLFNVSATGLSLFVTQCQIKEIEINFLNGLGIWSYLSMSFNPLEILRRYTFANDGIQIINLSSNRIRTIENEAFINLPNISEILLQNNLLQRLIPEYFSNVPCLAKLDLSLNKIRKLDRFSFRFFQQHGAVIKLDDNKIVEVDVRAFENFTSQNSSITLTNNLIESLSKGLFDNNMFSSVDLSCNKFQKTLKNLCRKNCSIHKTLVIIKKCRVKIIPRSGSHSLSDNLYTSIFSFAWFLLSLMM
jgi:Leucine-rich repeat (LRR) protein